MNKRTLVVSTFILASLAPLGARLALADTELARVGSAAISLEDFNRRYQDNLKFFQFKAPTKEAVLEDLIKRELGVQEAKKLGLEKDPVVQDRINTVLYQALLEKQLGKNFEGITVSDEEAKAQYAKSPEIRTSHIFVSAPPSATPEQVATAKERITRILKEDLKGGASFAEVAQKRSEGPAAAMGGDIDYKTREALDPAYYEAALQLKSPGKVSDVVRSRFGFHIIKLTAVRPWDDADQVQTKRQVFEAKRAALFDKYMASLRSQGKVTVRKELIKN